ncbi:MAG: deoxyribodipyrimidine photo-lyase [Gammaproteobacteria bacterium]|nr:deoxyribodipyrimidine photo-lyase [Gammaproteobacteria bacterium]
MSTTILWLRRDLRLTDNPALEAARHCRRLVPVYIHDPALSGRWAPGAASNWWLHRSLTALDRDLRQLGSRLVLRAGSTGEVLRELIRECNATRICWNRRYEPGLVLADRELKLGLQATGVEVQCSNASLLFEPWEIARKPRADATAPYKVFTAYWRACLERGLPGMEAHPRPAKLPALPGGVASLRPTDLGLLPRVRWDAGLQQHWQPGETGALARLNAFLENNALDYAGARERPAIAGTSGLSPHLHFGEIGPRQVVHAAQWRAHNLAGNGGPQIEAFIREIGWREFAHHLLFHFPDSDREPLNHRFRGFPWRKKYADDLNAWQRGRTGIPLVDAGMRQLWHSGWMHNRVRMIAASFLTKNLLIPWQEGAAWFWDTLVDADLANNSLGWQWVAGCGADAAPYFRIFNPVLQGEKFDPEGRYVRRWVPELSAVPARYIHKPWSAPPSMQGIRADYPPPMIDLGRSRERALAAYRQG